MAITDWQSMVRTLNYVDRDEPSSFRFVWWIEVYPGSSNPDDRKRLSLEVAPCPEPPTGTLSDPLDAEPASQLTISYRDATVSMLLPLTEALSAAERIMRLVGVGEGGG